MPEFNLIFPTIIFFLVLFLPFLYSQQDFLLSISPIFLNPSILYTSFIVFLFTNIYFIQVKNNTWDSLFFTFFIIFYSFLVQNAQNNLAKNVYLGNCQGEYIYKKSEYTSGRVIQGSESLYSFFSSDWNMSIVKSKEFGLQKVAIYGIQED